MMSTYRVFLRQTEYVEVEADSFDIKDGGTLVFYQDIDGELTSGPEQVEAYREWDNVTELNRL